MQDDEAQVLQVAPLQEGRIEVQPAILVYGHRTQSGLLDRESDMT